MTILGKMQILADSAQFDLCDYVNKQKNSEVNLPGIYNASSNGCEIPLFKTLMTNKCKNDCKYCINECKRNFTRMELSPREIAKVFLNYYDSNLVNGLFLSSGVGNTIDQTMENLIETIRILRKEYGYQDYIHLKIIPGASKDSIKRAMSLSDRISMNIEAATKDGLYELSSTKDYNKDILKRIKWINDLSKRDSSLAPSGQTTQLVIGANDETDEEILKRMESLYNKFDLRRTYFSAFTPVEGTELENRIGESTERTAQLYHADALLSEYNFKKNEIVFDENGQLSLSEDPKILAAQEMNIFPVEINSAPYIELIRVPGIGTKSAKKIINIRKKMPFKKLSDLKKIGVVTKRAEPYIKIEGKYQTTFQ
ncbi:MAG: radical SAM protein [Methanobacteriaceae archaeon]|nr:radical SAM protein [Methanobacteriaceae archaeon]